MEVITVGPREAARRLGEGGSALIDVRTPVEFQEVHAPAARNVPLSALDPAEVARSRPPGPLFVICRSGSRGRQACERLLAAGVAEVINVEGGTLAWADAGLPVVRGRPMMSLERQVRIAAGLISFVGAVLAMTVSPWFAGIPAFIGAGLVFAGVTDTCGMGLMLAQMPWNRVAATPPADATPACKA